MKLIIPMSGEGKRFRDAGYNQPKPLIPVRGRPIIERLLEAYPDTWDTTFICREDSDLPELEACLKRLRPAAKIIVIPPHKEGPVGALLAANLRSPGLLAHEACLVSYCDFGMSWSPAKLETLLQEQPSDSVVLCYRGFHPSHLRGAEYATCREDSGKVVEIREKAHFTDNREAEWTSAGAYYFGSGHVLKEHCERVSKTPELQINGEGYLSLVCHSMATSDRQVRVLGIDRFDQWGTPEDVAEYEYWARTLAAQADFPRSRIPRGSLQLLMPMAGHGSRFKDQGPKPLVEVLRQPMYSAAIRHLPATTRQTVVILKDLLASVQKHSPEVRAVTLDQPTDGQATTCETAVPSLAPGQSVLISSCDHGLVWDEQAWGRLVEQDPDVIVWGVRGYPGARRTPEAFAYIETNGEKVARVSVKKALSSTPDRDALLVGTFYFKTPALLAESVQALKKDGSRVNGEFYLDSVINLCVKRGLNVRYFEALGYLCWGTPDALREYNYWREAL